VPVEIGTTTASQLMPRPPLLQSSDADGAFDGLEASTPFPPH
jgi:hypothetical protein